MNSPLQPLSTQIPCGVTPHVPPRTHRVSLNCRPSRTRRPPRETAQCLYVKPEDVQVTIRFLWRLPPGCGGLALSTLNTPRQPLRTHIPLPSPYAPQVEYWRQGALLSCRSKRTHPVVTVRQ